MSRLEAIANDIAFDMCECTDSEARRVYRTQRDNDLCDALDATERAEMVKLAKKFYRAHYA